MAELTLRAVRDDADFHDFMSVMSSGFLEDLQEDEFQLNLAIAELDRMFGFHDGSRWVATAGDYRKKVALPGGALVPVAAVTGVTVSPSHRRKGLLTAMMRHQIDQVCSRDTEALAMLFASETMIYGRFGYGLSSFNAVLSGQVRDLGFRQEVDLGDGTVSEVDRESLLEHGSAIYDQVFAGLPGRMDRTRPWWDHNIHDGEERRKGSGPIRFALHHESDGTPSAFAIYRPKKEWATAGPNGELHVQEVRATNPRAYARIWRYLLDLDLIRSMQYDGAAVDERLRYLVADQRALQCNVNDGIFTRLVDVPRALTLRRYAADIDIVLEVADGFCPWNTGRYRLRGGTDGADCQPTSSTADIAISARDLGAVYLGGVGLQTLAGAGLVGELTDGSARRAATAFGWPVAPNMPDHF